MACAMPPLAKFLLTIVALLGISSAQVMGIGRGWLCHCTGTASFSNEADCAAGDCHHEESGGSHHHDDSDGGHEHEFLKESLKTTGFVPLAASLPSMVELILPDWLQPVPLTGMAVMDEPAEARPPPNVQELLRHEGVCVATSMVLLV